MRLYSEISAKKRAFVDALIKRFPEVAELGYCTRPQVEETFFANKDAGTPVGYPMWMTGTKEYKTSFRGVYYVPVPGDVPASNINIQQKKLKPGLTQAKTSNKIAATSQQEVLVEEQEFEAELLAAGIEL